MVNTPPQIMQLQDQIEALYTIARVSGDLAAFELHKTLK